ncbi:hypothetical protein ACSBOB_12135 [Mesorhizobium sp. ASY16-5R]|uniref:hypothetical protein n=1 Tax=Mesorhizobium sp. ASY16-5R TaxID=3445772 RepID=UPI003FA0EC45
MGAPTNLKRGLASMATLREKTAAFSELSTEKPLPNVGLLSKLTPEQRKKAFAYRGSENHGSDEFRNKQK